MRYLSVCSGIEAATVAWHPLGWSPAGFAEIDAFPRAVLKHHYPEVPLHGDFTKLRGDEDGSVDLLVGGTPCQSFSVAGLRGGLDDARGNLALAYLALAQRARPRWVVWENVPGVLSTNGGRDFGSFLGGLEELGYGWAYRTLDAKYFGVPQRRKRVFVVGYLGDWRRAAAVLFERHSLSGHPAPSREAGQRVAPSVSCGPPYSRRGNERVEAEAMIPMVANPLTARMHKGANTTCDEGLTLIPMALGFNWQNGGGYGEAHDGLGITEEGTGPLSRAQIPAVAFKASHYTRGKDGAPSEVFPPLSADADKGDQDPLVMAYNFEHGLAPHGSLQGSEEVHPGVNASEYKGHSAVQVAMAVRRITPREAERLQGFPDDYTLVPYRGKPATDTPRYKALGNSMAVPVMRWIGERIQMVDSLQLEEK